MKAVLNDAGKKHWGTIFPGGEVPVKNAVAGEAYLEGIGRERVYMVNWEALSPMEQKEVIDKLAKKSGAFHSEIRDEIKKVGLPLRERYVSLVVIEGRMIE